MPKTKIRLNVEGNIHPITMFTDVCNSLIQNHYEKLAEEYCEKIITTKSIPEFLNVTLEYVSIEVIKTVDQVVN